MNLTVDQFMSGLERTVVELPRVLVEWEDLDDTLCTEYHEQIQWLLSQITQMGIKHPELVPRLEAARGSIIATLKPNHAYLLSDT